MSTPMDFTIGAPLGVPMTAIEASAGTGKTYALSGLAVRLLAEEAVTTSQLAVVTFTRTAAAELRDRIRARLQEVLGFLAAPDASPHDPLIATLTAGAPDDVIRRHRALEVAWSELEDLEVSTIHGFAQQALARAGAAVAVDATLGMQPDGPNVVSDACADAYALAASECADHLPNLDDVVILASKLAGRDDIRVLPDLDRSSDDPEVSVASRTVEIARAGLARAARGRANRGVRNYDELLTDLRDALLGDGGDRAAAAISARLRVALIDEFQDTDPVQWQIFQTLFARGGDTPRLVVVGDPKQAIYRFRGADLHTYAQAVGSASQVTRLSTNWRSDAAMLSALDTLCRGVTFGEGATFHPVDPRPDAPVQSLQTRAGLPLPGLRIRLALGEDIDRTTKPKTLPHLNADAVRDAIDTDLIDCLVELFDDVTLPASGATDPSSEEPPRREAVTPGDVAVLVSARARAKGVQRALTAAGIPAVLTGIDSVLDSEGAAQWRTLLAALERPSDPRRVRAAACGVFGPFASVAAVDAVSDAFEAYQAQVAAWRALLARRGVVELVQTLLHRAEVTRKVLQRADGDRLVTDLEHVGDLLQASGSGEPGGLLGAIAKPKRDTSTSSDDPDARRSEGDRGAVQVMTIHAAKGLEFPVVCCVDLFSTTSKKLHVEEYHDTTGARVVDVCPDDDAHAAARQEEAEDRLRLGYVALTRARHCTFVWWSRLEAAAKAPLTRLLYGRDDSGVIDPEGFWSPKVTLPTDDEAVTRLEPLVARGSGHVTVEVHGKGQRRTWTPPTPLDPPELSLAEATVAFDRSWRRWSFTALTSGVERDPAGGWTSDHPDTPGLDEPDSAEVVPDGGAMSGEPDAGERGAVSRLAGFAGSAAFGVLVHAVLEQVDFASATLAADLDGVIADQLAWRRGDLRWADSEGRPDGQLAEVLRDGLVDAITTPLGGFASGHALCTMERSDRLDELGFDLVLPRPTGRRPLTQVGGLLLDHLASDDPYRPWAAALADGRIDADLVGSLTGSIDLVCRLGFGVDAPFLVVDYKTNRLHDPGTSPAGRYTPGPLVEAMAHSHYPLQALLYSVALHRYLRWRLPGYVPETHLGGVAYLFLRGMAGPDTSVDPVTGVTDGVARWDVPSSLVVALSDFFAATAEVA